MQASGPEYVGESTKSLGIGTQARPALSCKCNTLSPLPDVRTRRKLTQHVNALTQHVWGSGWWSLLQRGWKRHAGERRELIVVEEQGPGNTKMSLHLCFQSRMLHTEPILCVRRCAPGARGVMCTGSWRGAGFLWAGSRNNRGRCLRRRGIPAVSTLPCAAALLPSLWQCNLSD